MPVYVYGSVSKDEVVTTWMVENGDPSVELMDGSTIGNVSIEFIEKNLALIAGIACTRRVEVEINLEPTIIPDSECEQLYQQRYGGTEREK